MSRTHHSTPEGSELVVQIRQVNARTRNPRALPSYDVGIALVERIPRFIALTCEVGTWILTSEKDGIWRKVRPDKKSDIRV
jgi:hypothetical protein